jgi:hypothetical protein
METENILIKNPLIFFQKNYLTQIQNSAFPNAKFFISQENLVPKEILLTFPSKNDAKEFYDKYQGKSFDEKFN